jgi:hypothetical protein
VLASGNATLDECARILEIDGGDAHGGAQSQLVVGLPAIEVEVRATARQAAALRGIRTLEAEGECAGD